MNFVVGSLSLRSNFLCLKCFGYFEQLSDCENKIIQLKGDLWAIYKKTCERHGEEAEAHIKGVSTQTDLNEVDCECKSKKNNPLLNLKEERFDEDKGLLDNDDTNQGLCCVLCLIVVILMIKIFKTLKNYFRKIISNL